MGAQGKTRTGCRRTPSSARGGSVATTAVAQDASMSIDRTRSRRAILASERRPDVWAYRVLSCRAFAKRLESDPTVASLSYTRSWMRRKSNTTSTAYQFPSASDSIAVLTKTKAFVGHHDALKWAPRRQRHFSLWRTWKVLALSLITTLIAGMSLLSDRASRLAYTIDILATPPQRF